MKRILVVDDERDIAEGLAELLASAYQVSVAFDGAEALRLLRAGSVDAVVLDLMMPVMSGEALMAELQSQGIRVPVIFASAAKDLQERCKQSGAVDFIAKPFKFSALQNKLARVLGSDDGDSGTPTASGACNAGDPEAPGKNSGGSARGTVASFKCTCSARRATPPRCAAWPVAARDKWDARCISHVHLEGSGAISTRPTSAQIVRFAPVVAS